jgi:hypothetical protein
MRKQKIAGLILLLIALAYSINVLAAACCKAHCPNGKCKVKRTNSCACYCDDDGNPQCGATGEQTICVNQTQLGNLNGEVTLYQGFNSQAGTSRAAITQQIITLFANNNYYLDNNTQGGNVETYHNLVAALSAIQLSQAERASLNQYLSNCSLGPECSDDE